MTTNQYNTYRKPSMKRPGLLYFAALLALLLFPASRTLRTAWNSGVSFEIRTGGNDTNGGGYYAGGSQPNMSLFPQKNTSGCAASVTCYSNTADLSTTTASVSSSDNSGMNITCTGCNFDSNIVNQIVYLDMGSSGCTALSNGVNTLTQQWRQVTAYVSSTKITLDRSPIGTAGYPGGATSGTCAGLTVNIGGALNSPGNICNVVGAPGAFNSYVQNGIVQMEVAFYLKNDGVYWITNPNANVSGGITQCGEAWNGGNTITPGLLALIGYNSTRTDWQTTQNNPPVIKVCQNSIAPCTGAVNFASPTIVNMMAASNESGGHINYTVDCNNASNAQGATSGQDAFWNITVKNCPAGGLTYPTFGANNLTAAYYANAYVVNSSPGIDTGFCIYCVVSGVTNQPSTEQMTGLVYSIIYGGSGSANYGVSNFGSVDLPTLIVNNVIDGSGADAIHNTNTATQLTVINNIISNSAGKAINNTNANPIFVGYNAEYNNAGGVNNYGSWPQARAVNEISLSSNPYVNPSGHGYGATQASGLWCAGYPQKMPDGTANCIDIGATQHQITAQMIPDHLPDIIPAGYSDRMARQARQAIRAELGRYSRQVDVLKRLRDEARTYNRREDWVVTAGASLLIGVLGIALGRSK